MQSSPLPPGGGGMWRLSPHFGPFTVRDRGTSLKLKVKGTKVFSNIVYSICTHDSQRQQRSMSVFGLLVGGGGSRPLILGISSHIFAKHKIAFCQPERTAHFMSSLKLCKSQALFLQDFSTAKYFFL